MKKKHVTVCKNCMPNIKGAIFHLVIAHSFNESDGCIRGMTFWECQNCGYTKKHKPNKKQYCNLYIESLNIQEKAVYDFRCNIKDK